MSVMELSKFAIDRVSSTGLFGELCSMFGTLVIRMSLKNAPYFGFAENGYY